MKQIIVLLLLAPALSIAMPNCQEGNAIPKDNAKLIEAVGADWMKDAVYCDFGVFQVLAPKRSDIDAIALFKNGKLFLQHQKGFGINLFQDYGRANQIPYLTVQDLDGDNTYETLDYSIVNKAGRIIGDVKDKGMDGDSIVLKYEK